MNDSPVAHASLVEHALLHEDFGLNDDGMLLVVTAGRARSEWPVVVVSQRFSPGPEAGFQPGALLVPEYSTLFIGAGTRILAYDLDAPRRLWVDEADTGFWGWKRHGDLVIVSAELELAAWDLRGTKLWTTFVEPPWTYDVIDGELRLDVMGKLSNFPAHCGPGAGAPR